MRKIGWMAAAVLAGTLTEAAWAAKPATVRLKQEGLALELTFDNRQKIVVTSKGGPLEPGMYNVKTLRLMKQDDQKRTWEMHVEGNLSTLNSVTVEAEQEKVIDAGEPILFDIFLWVTGETEGMFKKVLLRVTPYGKYSEVYCPGAFLGGRRPAPPQFRITGDDGQVFEQGRLPASSKGVSEHTFRVPKDYKGKAKVELIPVMGPFTWKYRGQEQSLGK